MNELLTERSRSILFTVRMRLTETKEAIAAFFEKRPPDFSGTKAVQTPLKVRRLEAGRSPQTELL